MKIAESIIRMVNEEKLNIKDKKTFIDDLRGLTDRAIEIASR